MHITSVILYNFRNHKDIHTSFSPNINCFIGENGTGKSNLFEALYFLNTGKSFRTHRLIDLVHHEQSLFTLSASLQRQEISETLQVRYGKQLGRELLIDQTRFTSFLSLLGHVPLVFSAPEDLTIITGSPAERRRWMDISLSQKDPQYLYHLGRYQRALQHRNIVLKTKMLSGLYPLEHLLTQSATYLITQRKALLTRLTTPCTQNMQMLSMQRESLAFNYIDSFPGDLTDPFSSIRSKELEIGTTLIGPHRDDVRFVLHGKDLATYGSAGQKRSFLLSLRLAEWMILREDLNYTPIFGIDDFGAHLDPSRTKALESLIESMGQVFLTMPTDTLSLPHHRVEFITTYSSFSPAR